MKRSRLVLAVMATLVEEIALALFILLGLPRLGVNIPLGGLIAIMVGLATYAVISYRKGSRALLRKPVVGFTDMEGSRGTVTEPLAPRGSVKVRNELWEAESTGDHIETGEEVVVVKRAGLRLIVRRCHPDQK